LAFQPARGLDLAATREVYEAIREECREGAAALVVSYDLDELLDYCSRIVVLNRGELSEPGPGNERNPDVIGRLMVGAE
jgi:simple sugar transport system ATP-binding protein